MDMVNRALIILLMSVALIGCKSTNYLADYTYEGRSLGAEYDFPPYPEIFTGAYFPNHPRKPIHAIVRIGSRLAKEIEAENLRVKLDSASQNVDVSLEISDRVLTRASRYLGAEPIADSRAADFLLEVRVRDYGIDATDWDAAASFFIDAELTLLDGRTGREIYRTRVRERDGITPAIFGSTSVRNIVTAHAFSQLSVDELEIALLRLADYSADHLTDHLRNALRRARN